ncbi:MAG: zinc transporter ZupT [Caldicoprobacterales bacterium]|jgi:ZIP family zinc transporter|nr:zinc transporter ZupT [Clostridiales bacterium]
MHEYVLLAFVLTLLAGLATGIGGAIAFFAKRTNTKFLSVALGFSAGVMVYISFVEIFMEARNTLTAELGDKTGYWVAIVAFFAGMFVIALIDNLVPDYENPHEARKVEDITEDAPTDMPDHLGGGTSGTSGHTAVLKANQKAVDKTRLLRAGLFTALAVAIHNFPEGFATFMSALRDPGLGISIAIAIAIHNIPEGIAVSIPVYYATGSRRKAFLYSFLSGMSEPVGSIVGYLILARFMTETMFGIVFAAVGGIMVFISFDQLLPTAREYGEHHLSIYGLVSGMIVMAVSLMLF